MVRKVTQFEPADLSKINLQEGQTGEDLLARSFTDEQWTQALMVGMSYTARKDGQVIACAGLIPMWPGRAVAWTFIAQSISHCDMLYITREVRSMLKKAQTEPRYRRIEATVNENFWAGIRWMQVLGFVPEGIMRSYCPMGKTHILYARIAP